MDGVEITNRIVAATADFAAQTVKVLVLTTFHVDEAVYAALRAGASGFILKDAAPTELVAAVRALAVGEAWLDPAVARQLIDEFAARPVTGLPGPVELQSLTNREREVLVLIAHGLSNAEISDHLVVGEGTTKTHVSRIFAKLGFRDRAQAVATAFKLGLIRPKIRFRPDGRADAGQSAAAVGVRSALPWPCRSAPARPATARRTSPTRSCR